MLELLNLISDKIKKITDFDKMLAADYITYYGIEESEIKEYADSFLAECYHLINPDADCYNDDYGMYEPNSADQLPMAKKVFEKGKSTYTYGGQTITQYK